MLQTTIIGNIGSEPVTKSDNGKEFTAFKVAHNDTWTDQAGTKHTNVIWVDCILNGRPNVVEYLKKGTQVYVSGDTRLRVYSSEKDRCMKAGLTIAVRSIELLGGKSDDVPLRLYDKDGAEHQVSKWYLTDVKDTQLMSQRGSYFNVDKKGWVTRVREEQQSAAADDDGTNQKDGYDGF